MRRGITETASANVRAGLARVLELAPASIWSRRTAAVLGATAARNRAALLAVVVFSGMVNLLALTSSIYMLQLYDRVLPARSVPTLVALTVLMAVLFAAFGAFDYLRSRLMGRIAVRAERDLRERVARCVMVLPLRAGTRTDGQQLVRDLEQVRGFMAGPGPLAFVDLPWIPVYLGLAWLLHPWLGLLGMAGASVLVALMVLTELRSRRPTREASVIGTARSSLGEALGRNAEAVRALGMTSQLSRIWWGLGERQLVAQVAAGDTAARYGSASKVMRMALQSGVLGLGAFLAIRGEVTAGTMIAASILVARGLAPVEQAIASWRSFVAARQGMERLAVVLARLPADEARMQLPAPRCRLDVEALAVAPPGSPAPILHDVTFSLAAGDGLGIVGPSAAGKSTLARALVGAWLPQRGIIRIDGAALDQWSSDALGRHVGYLPQDIELLPGTIAQNVARFDPAATSHAIIAAADAAGIHEMILKMPKGYETEVGDRGGVLSAGQRQRVALARALYGDPFLVVLDEPNSNLDVAGDACLARAIAGVRSRGGIAIVVAHRPSAIQGLDTLLVLDQGRVQAFGPKEAVLRPAIQRAAAAQAAAGRLKVVTAGESAGNDDE